MAMRPEAKGTDLVRAYLAAMENRDLALAATMLSPEFEMVFPGTSALQSLQELVDWAAPRYRFVRKSYIGFDTCFGPNGRQMVYCFGTLAGEWPDGSPFEGIRFIDRFEIAEGLLQRQDVWNDLGEARNRA